MKVYNNQSKNLMVIEAKPGRILEATVRDEDTIDEVEKGRKMYF